MLTALLLAVGCAAAGAGSTDRPYARSLMIPESALERPEIVLSKTNPPGFHLSFKRNMPTPGWKIEVDAIDVDEKTRKIVARLTEVRPEGMAAQVITPTRFAIELGQLRSGRWLLEVWVRRSEKGKHQLQQALVLNAT